MHQGRQTSGFMSHKQGSVIDVDFALDGGGSQFESHSNASSPGSADQLHMHFEEAYSPEKKTSIAKPTGTDGHHTQGLFQPCDDGGRRTSTLGPARTSVLSCQSQL